MFPHRGFYSVALMTIILILDAAATPAPPQNPNRNAPRPSTSASKGQIESLAMDAVDKFTTAVKASNAAKENRDSANIELRAVAEMTDTVKKLQTIAEADGSLSSMATMQGVIGLQSALVNYAIYDMTLDEDILNTGRRSAENAMKLLAASIQLAKQETGSLPNGKNLL